MGMNFIASTKTMKTNTEVVSTRVQTYTFNNGELLFSIDHERVAREGYEIVGDYNTTVFDAGIAVSLKTLIHRTTSAPKGADATDWLLEALTGGAVTGRYRVTQGDKDRAETAMKGYKMAPDQTVQQFTEKYGVEYQDNAEWLAKHYMGVRASEAAAAKAAKSMI